MSIAENKIRNIMAYLTPQILSSIIPILTLPIITRFLTPEDFGVIALVSVFPGLIVSFLACNVQEAAQLYYFQYRNNILLLGSLINTTVAYLLFVFMMSMPIVFIIRHFLSDLIMGSPRYGFAMFVSYVSCCLSIPVTFYLILYRNMEEAKRFSFYTIIQLLGVTALNLLLVVVLHLGFIGMIYSTFSTTSLLFLLLFWQFQKEYPFSFNRKMLIDNFKYGIPLLPNLFVGSIYQFFDKFLLRSIVSLYSVGLYSIAQNLSGKIFVFITAVQSTFHPIFMKDMFDRGQNASFSVGRNFTIFTYISLSAVLGMILFIEEIVFILAPPSYYNAINVMLILLCGTAMSTFGKIVGLPLEYAKKTYLVFPLIVLGVVSNVFLNLLFIPLLGAMGAGIAGLIAVFVSTLVTGLVGQRYFKVIYEKRTLFFLYLNVFVSAVLLIYFRIINAPILLKYIIKIISLATFIMTGKNANIVNKKNLKVVLGLLKFKETAVQEVGMA